ncbi:MAG: hypothetical protein AAGL23_06005 [Pseudomonadota bacterium]
MSIFNPFAFGFVCVAASTVVGVDYVMQAKAAGSNPGEYAFSTYLDGYGIRLDDTLAYIDKTRRQSVEARTHLPMEPQGWERVKWDIGAIDMAELTRGMGIVQSTAAKDERRKAIALANYEAWEYRKGDQIVRISASFDPERTPSDTAIAGQLTGTFFPVAKPRYHPFKSVGNVPFLAVSDAKNPKGVTQTLLEARLGDDILIAVAADADLHEVLGLLEQIDFDALNLMLPEPLPYLGEGAPRLTNAQLMTLGGFQARALNTGERVPDDVIDAIIAGRVIAQVEEKPSSAVKQEAPQVEAEKPAAKRLQLSGGRSCLGETSKLCN